MTAAPGGGLLAHNRVDGSLGTVWLRVTQTGVQILLAFLLILSFEPRFADLDRIAVTFYVVTVMFCAAAAIFLIAPVALHRAMFALGRKGEVVDVSAKQAKIGMALLGCPSWGPPPSRWTWPCHGGVRWGSSGESPSPC